MDKNAIKKFAVWARTEMIARVSLKGVEYGITEDEIIDAAADDINGKVLTIEEKKQRKALIDEIQNKGYCQVMEEVAYTWFNRFSALRFMEVNGYLPSHVRVFTDEENNFKPQIITEAIHLDLDGLDMEKVFALKEAEKTEELYKYLLIVQCNALNKILPGMFQKIADYTELLLPDNLLREGSVVQQMIELIPEDDWKDAVQIIGWLYQYYNSEKKDDVFAALKKNVKITKENIPAATQLFTPDWIVRYMVENSLGRLWIEGHPNDELKSQWKYYLDEAEQEPEVQAQLAEIRKEYAALTPEQLRVIDPCSGSGHILAYMFDVLMQIYEAYGYTAREAVASIVENNIYGLDIDDRAAQLAYFSVMMKARQYDRRFFGRGIQPHMYAIVESNHVDSFAVEYFCNGDAKLKTAIDIIISELHDAKEYGSILNVTPQNWSALYNRFTEIVEDIHMSREIVLRELFSLVQVAETLAQKYDVIVTNPPYMGNSSMGRKLTGFVKKNYPNSKGDLYAIFIQACNRFGKKNAFEAMVTQQSWMFLGSYEKLREDVYQKTIVNMAHLGSRAFEEIAGEVVQTTSFVVCNNMIKDYIGNYVRLVDENSQYDKERKYLQKEHIYIKSQKDYASLPSAPVAYWVGDAVFNAFKKYPRISDVGEAKAGMTTGDNDRFLRLWYEVNHFNIGIGYHNSNEAKKSGKKWFPYNKGGGFRKWYGLNEYVVLWENDGYAIKNATKQGRKIASVRSERLYFWKSITWATLTTGMISCRVSENGHLFDDKGSSCFIPEKEYNYVLALINSTVGDYFLHALNPTMSFQSGNIGSLPVVIEKADDYYINTLSTENVDLCKQDWDSFETSWDFQRHPLLCKVSTIAEAFDQWQNECASRFEQLKTNEEELNRIFIGIYGLQDELTSDVEDKDVTVRKADLSRDIRSFLSYAVGCMFGRYSLDQEGLVYAGGEWDASKYVSFPADKDNIIPICDDEYFEDDIVGRFVEFVKTVYGEDTLDENLKFIADALDGKGQPKDVIRNYFLNDFYDNHCKIYQKRPIYWLFDSGKKNGFKALIYVHRYQPDTIARIRTDYVHEQQARYRTAIADLEQRIANASTGERVKLNKKLTTLRSQDTEIRAYEEKIHHLADQMISIDLDDGVKRNYAIFQDVLAKIK